MCDHNDAHLHAFQNYVTVPFSNDLFHINDAFHETLRATHKTRILIVRHQRILISTFYPWSQFELSRIKRLANGANVECQSGLVNDHAPSKSSAAFHVSMHGGFG